MTERRYLIVIEASEGENYSAYVPDFVGERLVKRLRQN